MARLRKNGKNVTPENGKFVPNCPICLRFLSPFLPISHIFYTFPAMYFGNFPQFTISPHFPHFPPFHPFPPFPPILPHFATIFPFSRLFFTSAASWLIRLTPMPALVSRGTIVPLSPCKINFPWLLGLAERAPHLQPTYPHVEDSLHKRKHVCAAGSFNRHTRSALMAPTSHPAHRPLFELRC